VMIYLTEPIVALLLALLALTAVTIVRMRSLFAAVMLTGIYSLLSAGWMLLLDAPDVAFTEAAVGAGIATMLMLGTLALTTTEAKIPARRSKLPLLLVALTGAILVYGTIDMPHYGDPEAPIHRRVAPEYIRDDVPDIRGERRPAEVQNVITTTLGSYRGYDTLGETTVIFAAGVGVLLLLRGRRRDEGGAEA